MFLLGRTVLRANFPRSVSFGRLLGIIFMCFVSGAYLGDIGGPPGSLVARTFELRGAAKLSTRSQTQVGFCPSPVVSRLTFVNFAFLVELSVSGEIELPFRRDFKSEGP